MKRKTLPKLVVFAAAWLVAAASSSAAESPSAAPAYPSKVVRIVSPFSSSSGPSVFMHVLAGKLSGAWGHQVIVDSRPGASGFIAIEAVKNAAPDGHELLMVSNAHVAINPALYKKLPYDPERDFVPVAMVYRTPYFFAVSASGPYPTVPARIEAAKANPGKLSYGSSFVGSPPHLGGAMFEFLTGTKMIHVPFKDQTQIYVSIANGDVSFALSTLGSALPLIKAGRVKVIAIAQKQRLKSMPEVPTVEEAGGPAGFEVDSWLALLAPRGTPGALVRRIHAEVSRQLGDPDVLGRMQAFGFEPAPGTLEQLAELIRADTKKYGDLVRRVEATAD